MQIIMRRMAGAQNQQVLEEQTRAFYGRLITSIDPEAEITYEFAPRS